MEEPEDRNNDSMEAVLKDAKLDCIASQLPTSKVGSRKAREYIPVPTDFTSAATAQWSPDGTCLLTTREDNTLETFVVPSDLLASKTHHELRPYSTLKCAEPIFSTAVFPQFQLSDPTTTLILHSTPDLPIKLSNALCHSQGIYASYPLVSGLTEEYIPIRSLLFTPDGTHFIAGGVSVLAIFDINRTGEKPFHTKKLGHKSRGSRINYGLGSGMGMGTRSIVSTMDISCDNHLAMGTLSRRIALFADQGHGTLITSFSPKDVEAPNTGAKGHGITQVKWSPCGRYLFAAERRSDGIAVYDIRGAGKRFAWLCERDAQTNVKLALDVVPTQNGGCEVWAGTKDGKVKMWKDPAMMEGDVKPDLEWSVHDDPVVATLVHGSGSVIATMSARDRDGSIWSRADESSDCESSSSAADSSSDEDSEDDNEDSDSESSSAEEEMEDGDSEIGDSMLKIWLLQ